MEEIFDKNFQQVSDIIEKNRRSKLDDTHSATTKGDPGTASTPAEAPATTFFPASTSKKSPKKQRSQKSEKSQKSSKKEKKSQKSSKKEKQPKEPKQNLSKILDSVDLPTEPKPSSKCISQLLLDTIDIPEPKPSSKPMFQNILDSIEIPEPKPPKQKREKKPKTPKEPKPPKEKKERPPKSPKEPKPPKEKKERPPKPPKEPKPPREKKERPVKEKPDPNRIIPSRDPQYEEDYELIDEQEENSNSLNELLCTRAEEERQARMKELHEARMQKQLEDKEKKDALNALVIGDDPLSGPSTQEETPQKIPSDLEQEFAKDIEMTDMTKEGEQPQKESQDEKGKDEKEKEGEEKEGTTQSSEPKQVGINSKSKRIQKNSQNSHKNTKSKQCVKYDSDSSEEEEEETIDDILGKEYDNEENKDKEVLKNKLEIMEKLILLEVQLEIQNSRQLTDNQPYFQLLRHYKLLRDGTYKVAGMLADENNYSLNYTIEEYEIKDLEKGKRNKLLSNH